jgi:hypothetical protein
MSAGAVMAISPVLFLVLITSDFSLSLSISPEVCGFIDLHKETALY